MLSLTQTTPFSSSTSESIQNHFQEPLECSGKLCSAHDNFQEAEIYLGKKKHIIKIICSEVSEDNLRAFSNDQSKLIIKLNQSNTDDDSSDTAKDKKLFVISAQATYKLIIKALGVQSVKLSQPYDTRSVVSQVLLHSLGKKKITNLHTFLLACKTHVEGLQLGHEFELPAHHLQLPYIVHIRRINNLARFTLKPSHDFIYPVKRPISFQISSNAQNLEHLFDFTSFKEMLWDHIEGKIEDLEMKERIFRSYTKAISAIFKKIPFNAVVTALEDASKQGSEKIWILEKKKDKIDGQIKVFRALDQVECILTIRSQTFEIGAGSQKTVYKSFSLFKKKAYVTCYSLQNQDGRDPLTNIMSSIFETALALKVQNSLKDRQIESPLTPTYYHFSGNLTTYSETTVDHYTADLFHFINKPTDLISLEVIANNENIILLQIAKKIAESLQALHEAGIVHRDIKPENCLLRIENDTVINASLIDLGLSTFQGVQKVPCGSHLYIAPETALAACNANNIETVTKNSDLWGLGILFYVLFYKKTIINDGYLKRCIALKNVQRLQDLYLLIEEHIDKQVDDSSPIKSILKKLLRVNREERAPLEAIIIELDEKIKIAEGK